MSTFIKDPDSVLDYKFDWAAWLDEDTIATSTMTVSSGITLDSDTNTTTTATAWISGGSVGATYSIVNHITTAGGRTEDRTIYLKVINK